MFTKSTSDQELDKAVARVLVSMKEDTPGSDGYVAKVDQLVKLHGLKVNITKNHISRDTLATIAANLVGIVVILHYERVDVVASKALSFVQKLR